MNSENDEYPFAASCLPEFWSPYALHAFLTASETRTHCREILRSGSKSPAVLSGDAEINFGRFAILSAGELAISCLSNPRNSFLNPASNNEFIEIPTKETF
jgi:hypothetical protein